MARYAIGRLSSGPPYSTSFPTNEPELSEGGLWVSGLSTGLLWTAVAVTSGIARGTQTGAAPATAGYDDSLAHLLGYPANQSATITVHRAGTIDSTTREVECLTRFAITANNARGYEFLYAYDGSYSQITRWNGAKDDFTPISNGTPNGALADGDMLKFEAVGSTLTGYRSTNGGGSWTTIATITDTTFATGNPGLGLWKDGGTNGDANLGISQFSAAAL